MSLSHKDYIECANLMERIVHKYNQTENRKMEYGTGQKLSRREIHTIHAIKENPEANITELARLQGVTKGAVSQMIYRLVDKGLVIKSVSAESDAEVSLDLSDLGLKAFENHMEYHKRAQHQYFHLLEDMTEEAFMQLINLLTNFDHMLDEELGL